MTLQERKDKADIIEKKGVSGTIMGTKLNLKLKKGAKGVSGTIMGKRGVRHHYGNKT